MTICLEKKKKMGKVLCLERDSRKRGTGLNQVRLCSVLSLVKPSQASCDETCSQHAPSAYRRHWQQVSIQDIIALRFDWRNTSESGNSEILKGIRWQLTWIVSTICPMASHFFTVTVRDSPPLHFHAMSPSTINARQTGRGYCSRRVSQAFLTTTGPK